MPYLCARFYYGTETPIYDIVAPYNIGLIHKNTVIHAVGVYYGVGYIEVDPSVRATIDQMIAAGKKDKEIVFEFLKLTKRESYIPILEAEEAKEFSK